MGCKKTLILFVCWIIYLCLGALAFIAIEKGNLATQQEARAEFNEAVADFAREYSSCGVTRDSLLTFMVNNGRHTQTRGVFHFNVDPSKGVQEEWSMTNALVFTSEIVTTIGHGTLTPYTARGRLACILYALFGIPLCGFMLAAVGDAALILADKIDGVFRRRLRLALLVNAARLFVIVLVFWSITVTLPTLIYTRTEGWNWVKAQYFSFTGMSTVGFGDVKIGADDAGTGHGRFLAIIFRMGLIASRACESGAAALQTAAHITSDCVCHTVCNLAK
ncbi:potassium channel subfamily K member 10-like [Asterias rubens]|uniref:potassium channel subfamily K member 10-like n=1 Tax=Asterias rubens TaxID=7604 RepID=UPI0014552C3D|nr:potassium channel subfamily K member 10-like [Asterias rubens]